MSMMPDPTDSRDTPSQPGLDAALTELAADAAARALHARWALTRRVRTALAHGVTPERLAAAIAVATGHEVGPDDVRAAAVTGWLP